MTRRLDGSLIQSGTITSTQLSPAVANSISAGGGPRVTSLIYPGNDTAGNTVGGQTVYVVGSGFETNNAIYINGNAVPSKTFISASNISFTTPALSTGIYPVYVINTDTGATAIFVPGYVSSAEPSWVTAAGTLNSAQDENSSWSYSLSATGDEPITYALAAGSSLPTGVSLASNGAISGTISSPTGNTTTYTFSVVATDAQNQESTRQFSVTTSTSEGAMFANNVLLIHADGTNNKNNHTFLDSSNNNFSITRNGNATQGSFSPFSQTGWSAYFDGTGDYLRILDNNAFTLGSSDFTIECWLYPTSVGSTYRSFSGQSDSSGTASTRSFRTAINSDSKFEGVVSMGSSNYTATSTISAIADTWQHFAFVRDGNTGRLYINGVQSGTVNLNGVTINNSSNQFSIGAQGEMTSGLMLGYISNYRMVVGTCLYPNGTSFIPSTTPLTAISNTALLTCHTNRFFDASNNNFAITRNGDVSVQSFSPFAPSTEYSTANVGGSGYFDGTGDGVYLNYGSETHSYWNNDFTFEYWVKTTSTSSIQAVFSSWFDSGLGSGSYFFSIESGVPKLHHRQSSGTNQGAFTGAGSTVVNDNAWHHVVFTQVTGAQKTFRCFVDGVLRGYKQETNWTQSSSNTNIYIAQQGPGTFDEAGRYFTGHLSGLRLSNNIVSAYSTSSSTLGTTIFSVPTAPPTNTANTIALLNFTNAGIFDQTTKNVLETVGDAKISTSVYKYGTGSIAFDGTGDNITIPSSPNLDFGTGDFTIELWANFSALSTNRILLDKWASGNANSWQLYWRATGTSITFLVGASTVLLQDPSTSRITTNTWYHIAVTRSGTTNRLFIDGVEVASATNSTNLTNTNRLCIGEQLSTLTNDFSGYIDDLRITKGYARYTSNFTAPTSAFKDK